MVHRHDLIVDGPAIALLAVFFILRLLGHRQVALLFAGAGFLIVMLAAVLLPK